MAARGGKCPIEPEPFFAWPGWSHVGYFVGCGMVVGAWFALVYGGCDWITAHRTLRVPVHVAWELQIPFVPWMAPVYLSMNALFLLAPFILRTRAQLRAMTQSLLLVTGIAGVFFLLLPAECAFPPHGDAGIWAGVFGLADGINLTYNLAPSLHVTFAVLCAGIFAQRARAAGKVALWSWAGAIALSTVLTHQHHVVDVLGGLLLGQFGVRLFHRRLPEQHSSTTGATGAKADTQ